MYVHLMSLLAVSSPSAVAPFPQHPSAQRAPLPPKPLERPPAETCRAVPLCVSETFPSSPSVGPGHVFFSPTNLLLNSHQLSSPPSRPGTDIIIVLGTDPNWANLQQWSDILLS